MNALHEGGPMTVLSLRLAIPDAPSYSGVRGLLRILSKKGFVASDRAGKAYVYRPTEPSSHAGENALSEVTETYYQGSPYLLIAALLRVQRHRFEIADFRQMMGLVNGRTRVAGPGAWDEIVDTNSERVDSPR